MCTRARVHAHTRTRARAGAQTRTILDINAQGDTTEKKWRFFRKTLDKTFFFMLYYGHKKRWGDVMNGLEQRYIWVVTNEKFEKAEKGQFSDPHKSHFKIFLQTNTAARNTTCQILFMNTACRPPKLVFIIATG
jgi:hypothetical protein